MSISKQLRKRLTKIEEEWGGDVCFLNTVKINFLQEFEEIVGWKLPAVFEYFYTQETNGVIIDDKRIYSVYDPLQKKTWVENLTRMNDYKTSPWFKGRPYIFNDYLIIGVDEGTVFCLSKKYDLPNPAIYLCDNPNDRNGVDLNKTDLDLISLIEDMVNQAFY